MATDSRLDDPTTVADTRTPDAADCSPAELAAALGHTYTDPEWRTTSLPPVDPARFGKDHYSALLYIESRAVDNKGSLEHDHMRCHGSRHPMLVGAGKRGSIVGGHDGSAYPTKLRRNAAGEVETLPDHDDYDCLDDLVAAGWVTVTMPAADHDAGCFRDQWNRPVALRGEPPISPAFYTGMDELILARHATWGLTDDGYTVAHELRRHQAEGGNLVSFANQQYGPATGV